MVSRRPYLLLKGPHQLHQPTGVYLQDHPIECLDDMGNPWESIGILSPQAGSSSRNQRMKKTLGTSSCFDLWNDPLPGGAQVLADLFATLKLGLQWQKKRSENNLFVLRIWLSCCRAYWVIVGHTNQEDKLAGTTLYNLS